MNLYPMLEPALAAVAAAGGVVMMASNLRKARAVEDVPIAKVRSAAQGYTSLNGFAKLIDLEPVIAPLTGTRCLWYRYTIERYDNNGRRSSWDTVESGSSEQGFSLDDDTGLCHIDPRHADVTTAARKRWYGSEREPAAIVAAGVQQNQWLRQSFQRYRYTEHRIHAGEWLYALGWFETLHAPSPEQQTAVQMKTLLNQWKQNRRALLARFDSNGDGELDLQEWERARAAAAREAQLHVQQQPATAPINTLARPPLRDRPFVIATTDQRELAGRYRRNAFFALALGFGFAILLGYRHLL